MIYVDGIGKKYGKKEIIHNIGFRLKSGEQLAVIGENGTGKSTLLRILAGVEKPDQGSVEYFQKKMDWKKSDFHKFCGYVPQTNPLLESMKVIDNLRLWSGNYHWHDEQLIEMFHLKDLLDKPVKTLSGGMKRRVAIACAMTDWPPVMIMDEPTAALDTVHKEILYEWMKKYRDMNGIIILSTHELKEKEESDYVLNL